MLEPFVLCIHKTVILFLGVSWLLLDSNEPIKPFLLAFTKTYLCSLDCLDSFLIHKNRYLSMNYNLDKNNFSHHSNMHLSNSNDNDFRTYIIHVFIIEVIFPTIIKHDKILIKKEERIKFQSNRHLSPPQRLHFDMRKNIVFKYANSCIKKLYSTLQSRI